MVQHEDTHGEWREKVVEDFFADLPADEFTPAEDELRQAVVNSIRKRLGSEAVAGLHVAVPPCQSLLLCAGIGALGRPALVALLLLPSVERLHPP